MGLFSKIAKGVKNIVKGVGKVFKKVVKGIKKFASSKFGKYAMLALSVWSAGAAAGFWQSPWQTISGAFGKTGTGATAGGTGVTTGAAPSVAAPTVETVAQTGTGASMASAPEALQGAVQVGAPQASVAPAAQFGQQAAQQATQQAAQGGLMSRIGETALEYGGKAVDLAKSGAQWMVDNPALTKTLGEIGMAAFGESPEEAAERMRQRRLRTSNIAGVGYEGGGEPIYTGLLAQAEPQVQAPTYSQPTQYRGALYG